MFKYLILLGLLFPAALFAQDFDAKNYNWEDKPVREQLSEEESKEPFIVLKDKRIYEYIYDDQKELVMFETVHKKVRANEDGAIQQFNKVYIPLNRVIDIVELKARSISKDGKIVEVDKRNIKELKDVEEYGNLKIFAIEGVEQGSDMEYFYTLKKDANYYDSDYFQIGGTVKNVSIQIISPENLVFKAKGYNGFPAMRDTVLNEKNYLSAEVAHIPAMNKEKYASYSSNLMRVEYKLAQNLAVGRGEILTWADAAKRYFEIFNTPDAKADKQIEKTVKGLKLDGLTLDNRIRRIESYIKNAYRYKADGGPEYTDLEFIMKSKAANLTGTLRLFVHFLNAAGIKHQVAMTTNRKNSKFDKDFMTWNYLDKTAIYFPETQKFLAPTEFEYRYGMVPSDWEENEALFIKPVQIGEMSTGVPSVQRIPALSVDKSNNNLWMEVKFPADLKEANIHMKHSFAGHSAMFVHPYYSLLPDDKKEEAAGSLLKMIGEDATVSEKKVDSYERDEAPIDNPITFEGKLALKSVIEKAGKKYLFKVGTLIGPQAEMYQEKTRQCEIDTEYPHEYKREIIFTVPDGYTVQGLESLKMQIEDANKTVGFVSDYVQTGNTVKVTIHEYYKQTLYPIGDFEQFRKVVNAAADFNKVVLVFEKQ